jgi:hypothetical protein
VAAPSPATATAPEGNQAKPGKEATVSQKRARKGEQLKKKLEGLSKEDRLKFWKRKAPQEGRSKVVGVLLITYDMCNQGRESPIIAWRDILDCLDCPKPLYVSVVGQKLAELYFEENDITSAREALLKSGALVEHRALTQSDVSRRAGVYMRGYFLPYRHAALHGLDLVSRQEVLRIAEESAMKVTDAEVRKRRLAWIQKDRGLFAKEDPLTMDQEAATG